MKRKRENEEGSKQKSKICFVCGPVEAKKMGRHLYYQHLPWWLSPAITCWTCQQAERSLSILRARHSNCGGYWETDERFRRWAELILGLLDCLRASLGCATLEAFLGLDSSSNPIPLTVYNGQECMINALSLVTGVCVNLPHPASLAELSARPIIRALLPCYRDTTWRSFDNGTDHSLWLLFRSRSGPSIPTATWTPWTTRVVDLFSGNGASSCVACIFRSNGTRSSDWKTTASGGQWGSIPTSPASIF